MFLIKLLKYIISKNRKKIINSIKSKMAKEECSTENNICKPLTQEEKYSLVDLTVYPKPKYLVEYDPNKETIVIVDDLPLTEVLYNTAFLSIERKTKIDLLKEYNVIFFLGRNIGFSFINFLRTEGIKVDYAMLDITINTIVKVTDTNALHNTVDPLEVDGVDLAIELNKIYSDSRIRFYSTHTMNPRNPLVSGFMVKFKDHFKVDIRTCTTDKLSNLDVGVAELLNKEELKCILESAQ